MNQSKVERFFCKAGPVVKEIHYQVDPLSRFSLDEILSLIDQRKYFILHAPRQTGKTSYMLALMDYLNKTKRYRCLYINLEDAWMISDNVLKSMRSILDVISQAAIDYLGDSFFQDTWKQILSENGEYVALERILAEWCKKNEKPVILLFDRTEKLEGDTLISVLRQLRSGYPNRPVSFPQSIILCGLHDVGDNRAHSDKNQRITMGGSGFNIKSAVLRLENFSLDEIKTLYNEHTKETGQSFDENIFPLVWDLTEGQPWLVNSIAYETCFRMEEGRDRRQSITLEMIKQAKENIIEECEIHLHRMIDKLKEDRVRPIIEPMLVGSDQPLQVPEEDIEYAVDHGLIVLKPHLRIANCIYKEFIPRRLIYGLMIALVEPISWYIDENTGQLNMDNILTSFQGFYKRNFERLVGDFEYAEAAPQLLFQAYLQHVVYKEGRIEPEYGLGRQRTDFLVTWSYPGGKQQMVIELKLLYDSLETTIKKGLEQTWGYMDTCGTTEGYLLVFDTSSKASWEKKIFKKTGSYAGREIKIFGM